MSKLTKAESARINGAKSKGPKTEQGKQRSRLNALRHGLAANTVCLTEKERPIFEAMVAAYEERFRPADTVEEDLIEQMCVAKWRQRRCWSMETRAQPPGRPRPPRPPPAVRRTRRHDAQHHRLHEPDRKERLSPGPRPLRSERPPCLSPCIEGPSRSPGRAESEFTERTHGARTGRRNRPRNRLRNR